MAVTTLLARADVPDDQTFNAPSLYPSPEAWETAFETTQERIPATAERFAGKLGENAATLADYFDAINAIYEDLGKLAVYATMFAAVDTGDQEATLRSGRIGSLWSQASAAFAFARPEMLAIGQDTIQRWLDQETRLAPYAHYFDDLFRQQAHIRSAEVEEILGMAQEPLGAVSRTAGMLANADLVFAPAITSDGDAIDVAQGNFDTHMISPDREQRRTAYESYTGAYLAMKNTFASNLEAAIRRDVFFARARQHGSALEAALFESNVPSAVFHNLIDVFKHNLPTWHRYWRIRRRILGIDPLYPYDTWAPLTEEQPHVPYEQAVDWISTGMEPLGADYVAALRRGTLEDRWVDRSVNRGKRQGAFSFGVKGALPFIMMSYDDSLKAMSTLAHELGHSMHSYLTNSHQPLVYTNYSLFVAEVASNFNQAMTRAHLLATNNDPAFQVAVIEEAMYNFHRYFFQMPTLARFELETHERIERGEGLNASAMINLMADLFGEGYGDQMEIERDRVGMTWAMFGHLYANFYVYQYATGIAAAHALSQHVLEGLPGAADAYLEFLKAGSSLYPLDALKLAGVDMTQPDAVETTFGVMASYVDRLEALLDA